MSAQAEVNAILAALNFNLTEAAKVAPKRCDEDQSRETEGRDDRTKRYEELNEQCERLWALLATYPVKCTRRTGKASNRSLRRSMANLPNDVLAYKSIRTASHSTRPMHKGL